MVPGPSSAPGSGQGAVVPALPLLQAAAGSGRLLLLGRCEQRGSCEGWRECRCPGWVPCGKPSEPLAGGQTLCQAPRVRSLQGWVLPASLNPLPTSSRGSRHRMGPTWHSCFRKRTQGHGHFQQQPGLAAVWVSLEGRELGDPVLTALPRQLGPVHPGHSQGEHRAPAHRARPCRRRGHGSVCRGVPCSCHTPSARAVWRGGCASTPPAPPPATSCACLGPRA